MLEVRASKVLLLSILLKGSNHYQWFYFYFLVEFTVASTKDLFNAMQEHWSAELKSQVRMSFVQIEGSMSPSSQGLI
jgi:hypothetical protein